MTFLELLRQRRSRYQLADRLPVSFSLQQLEDLLAGCLEQTPSAFNSQTARIMLLTEQAHTSLWQLTAHILRPLVPPSGWEKTQEKIDSFAGAYATVLYFDDQQAIQSLQTQFPLYKDQFPVWAQQANGMLQLAVWMALAETGIGASLQHYNPLIDAAVAETFAVPKTWKLVAQMPLGVPLAEPGDKAYLPLSQRFIVRKQLAEPGQAA